MSVDIKELLQKLVSRVDAIPVPVLAAAAAAPVAPVRAPAVDNDVEQGAVEEPARAATPEGPRRINGRFAPAAGKVSKKGKGKSKSAAKSKKGSKKGSVSVPAAGPAAAAATFGGSAGRTQAQRNAEMEGLVESGSEASAGEPSEDEDSN